VLRAANVKTTGQARGISKPIRSSQKPKPPPAVAGGWLMPGKALDQPLTTAGCRKALLPTLAVAVGDAAKAFLIFGRSDERTHHAAVVTGVAIVQYAQPKSKARSIYLAAQVAEVFHLHERRIVNCGDKGWSLSHIEYCASPTFTQSVVGAVASD